MAKRNFWVHGNCDGRKTPLVGGPSQSTTGGMYLTLTQLDKGKEITAAMIQCIADEDGNLTTTIWANGEKIQVKTNRK